MKRLKAGLIAVHLYSGLALCLLFATWFVSGVAMAYYRTPVLTDEQRLAFAQPVDPRSRAVAPSQAERLAADWQDADLLRLGSWQGRPLYRWKTRAAGWRSAWADTGGAASFDAQSLAPEAQRWFGDSVSVRYEGVFEEHGQWSYFTAARDHYPLHKFSTTGWAPRAAFFSSRTGEVIVATSLGTRLLYYLGPGLHYFSLYPIRNNDPLWRGLVNWSSGAGALTCLIGIIIGLWQLRWGAIGTRRRVVPYARRWMRWHHWTGLLFGLPAFTFVLSGLFSMNPAGIFASTEVPAALRAAFDGRRLPVEAQPSPAQVFAAMRPDWRTREFEWKRLRGRPYVLATESQSTHHLLWPQTDGLTSRAPFTDTELLAFVADLLPSRIDTFQRLDEFDDYYYARKDRYLPLPVVRVRLHDARSTWYYMEPASGQLFLKSDQGTRVRRWAYNGLHSLDPQFLLRRGLAWDATIWIVSVFGLALSVTGCVVAWQWLRKSGWLFARPRPARHTERPQDEPTLAGAVRRDHALNS